MADDVKRTLVQLDYDQASGKRVATGLETTKQRIAGLRKELADAKREFGTSAASMGEYGGEAKRVANRGDELRSALRSVREEVVKTDGAFAQARGIKQYEASLENTRREAQTLGRFEGGARSVASAAGTLGGADIQAQIAIGAEVADAVQGFQVMRAELPMLAAQLGTSTLALGALGIGLVGFTFAVGKLKDSIADTGEATRAFIDANQKYAEVIATGTTEDVNKAIRAEEDRQKALRIEREMLEEFLAQVDDVDGLAGAFLDLNDALGANYGGVEDVKNRLGDLNSELGASEQLTGRWQNSLEDGATAANDAAAAEQRLYDKRQNLLDQERQAVAGALNMTEDQLDQSLADLGNEFDYWWQRRAELADEMDRLSPSSEAYSKKKEEYDFAKQQLGLLSEAIAIKEGIRGFVQYLDDQRQAAEDATTAGQRYIQSFTDASRMTSDQANKEIDLNNIKLQGLEMQRDALEKLATTNPVAAATLKDVNDQIADLTHRNDELTEVIIPAAEARELEARMAKRFIDEAALLAQTGDDLADALAQAAEEADKYAQTLAKRNLKLAQDAEKFNLERTRDLADHYAEMAELDADYYADRGDIIRDMRADLADINQERLDELEDLNDDLADLASDHADAMRKIGRDANRDIQSATARFNAWGIFQAQQNRRDALEDEQDQYTKEQEEREDQFADRIELLERERDETLKAADQALRDLDDQHRRERSEKERAFAEQLRREDENRRLQLQHQQQQWNLEDQQRQTHYAQQSARTTTHHANLDAITLAGLAKVEANFAGAFAKIAATASLPSSASSAVNDAFKFVTGVLGGSSTSSVPDSARYTPASPRTSTTIGSSSRSVVVESGAVNVNFPTTAGGVNQADIESAVFDAVIKAAEAIL